MEVLEQKLASSVAEVSKYMSVCGMATSLVQYLNDVAWGTVYVWCNMGYNVRTYGTRWGTMYVRMVQHGVQCTYGTIWGTMYVWYSMGYNVRMAQHGVQCTYGTTRGTVYVWYTPQKRPGQPQPSGCLSANYVSPKCLQITVLFL